MTTKIRQFLALGLLALLATTAPAQTTLPPVTAPVEAKAAEYDIQKDPTYLKVKADLASANDQVAQLQQVIQTIQKQRDEYSKAFLDAQASGSLQQSQIQALQKQLDELKKAPKPTPAPPAAK
jgi:peptidoglycan hydrolase CwlO-like protein